MKRVPVLLIGALAMAAGVIFSIVYIDPRGGSVLLSQIILGMSGGKLGFSLAELLLFVLQMFPFFIFCAIVGTSLYKHLCFSSIYIFSRHPQKIKWYTKELLVAFCSTAFFKLLFIASTLWITDIFYDVLWDLAGFQLLFVHFLVYSLWLYCVILSINIVAIYLGSDGAFVVVVGLQMILFTSFSLYQQGGWIEWAKLNPNAHLVMSWHGIIVDLLNLEMPVGYIYPSLDVVSSVGIMLILAVILSLLGGVVVAKHDILMSNTETGGT